MCGGVREMTQGALVSRRVPVEFDEFAIVELAMYKFEEVRAFLWVVPESGV
jgi:hypothetical protein